MKQLLILCTLVLLFSCNKGNKDPEPYIVAKIEEDSTDATGVKWYNVTFRNSAFKHYHSSECKIEDFNLGDTVLIGRNEVGDYIISGEVSNFKLMPVPPDENH